ncbi:MAG: hypothetical protein K8S98_00175 [Planctomycetes bacterium]|nr:hypothetical protein [Planctomycetota bacterium]
MRKLVTLLVVALTLNACRTDPAADNAARAQSVATGTLERILPFQHQSAVMAANQARAEFGRPPMEGEVKVQCDRRTNSWIVTATAADMARVEAIAARFDQP